ncbi:hypothetical protein HYT58_00560 [Candidatus Woesearchaeota archaeon]|nr:hypothetical protein [Candidatus Woesearchaeota archaeon]
MGGSREFIFGIVFGIFLGFVFLNSGMPDRLSSITGSYVVDEQDQKPVVREIVREVIKEKTSDGLGCDDKISLINSQLNQLKNELRNINGNLVTAQMGARGNQLAGSQEEVDFDNKEINGFREQGSNIQDEIDELNSELSDVVLNCKSVTA